MNGEERIEDNAITIPFSARVIGTGASEWINLPNPADDFIFGAGNDDRVNLPLNLQDYSIFASGNQLTLEAPQGNTIQIFVNGNSTLQFADGQADLSLSFGPTGAVMNLGNAVIPDGETLTDYDSVFGGTSNDFLYVSIDTGTIETPVTLDAAGGAKKFMDDASIETNVIIDNFSEDDRISIYDTGETNADVSDYSFSNDGTDVRITCNYNDSGTMNSILLTGVVSTEALVYDQASFEAAIGFDAFTI
jgi:hypothetical protein